MAKYRVLLANGVVLDVRDMRDHSAVVGEWIAAVNACNAVDKAISKEDSVGIEADDSDTDISRTLVTFRGEDINNDGLMVGAATIHAVAIAAIGVPEPIKVVEKTFEETCQGLLRMYLRTKAEVEAGVGTK